MNFRRWLSLVLSVLLCCSIPFSSGVVALATQANPNGNPEVVIGVGRTGSGITNTLRTDVYSGGTLKYWPIDLTGINQNDQWLYVSFTYEFAEAIMANSSLSFTHNMPNGTTVKGAYKWRDYSLNYPFQETGYYAILGLAGFTQLYVNGEYFAIYDGAYGAVTGGDFGQVINAISLPATEFETDVWSVEFRYLLSPTAIQRIAGTTNYGDLLQKIESGLANGYGDMEWGYGDQTAFVLAGGSFVYESSLTTNGLLANIVGWLNSIIQALNNIWNTITSGFSNVVSAITSLPQKLWTLIENGLKALFVPTEDQLQEYHDKWSELMSDRFGALYQCMDLVDQFFTDIQDYSATGVIEMPGVTVDLAGTPWTFGGYEIDVVPDGFDFLADSLKIIVDIVCTLAFINAMKNRFERLLQ